MNRLTALLNRLWPQKVATSSNGHGDIAEFAGEGGGFTGDGAPGAGTVPWALGMGGTLANPTNGVRLGSKDYAGDIGNVAQVDPQAELVSANGTWAGVGPLNLQVLSHERNIKGERFNSTVIEAMLDDDAVKPALDTLKIGILCGELKFHAATAPDSGTTSDFDPAEAQRAAEFCERAHKNLPAPLNVWAWDFLDYLVYGHKVAEIVLQEVTEGPDAGLYYLGRLKVKGRWSYHLCTDPMLNLLSIYAQTIYGPAYIEARHFLISSWGKRDDDPRGSKILKAAVEPWRRKQRRLKSQSKGDDQFGTPSLCLTMPEGGMVESQELNPKTGKPWTNLEYAMFIMDRMENGQSIAIPFGAVLDVIESQRDGAQLVNSIDYDDRCIVRAMLLSAKGMLEPEHYTQGGGEHAQQKERGLADCIRDALLADFETQLFGYLLTECKGKRYAQLYTPKLVMGAMPLDDFLKLASALGVILQSGGFYKSLWDKLLFDNGLGRPRDGELRIGPNGPIPDTLTAPAGSVQDQDGKIEEYPAAPPPPAPVEAAA